MLTTKDLAKGKKKKEAKEAKILTTRDIKLPVREEVDSEKVKKTKSMTATNVLKEGWKPKR